MLGRKSRVVWIWGIFFVVSLILLHMSIRIYIGDEVKYFSHVLDESSVWEFIKLRYTSAASRIIIEVILIHISRNVFLWKICNILMYLLWVYSLYKITKVSSGIIFGLVMLYSFTDMATAGWIATTLNYFWPLALGTYSFVVIDKIVQGKKVKIYEVILSVVAEIIAVNVEQYVVLHMLCLGIVFAYLLSIKDYSKKKFSIIGIHFMVSIASLLFIATCPGNEVRKIWETKTRMKNFNTLSLMDKIISGYNTTISGFLNQYCLLFFVFLLVLSVCVIRKSVNDENKYWIISISAVPPIIAIVVSIGNIFQNGYFVTISEALREGIIINGENWNKPIYYLVFISYAIFTISIIFSIIYIFDNIFVGIIHGGLFLCAVLVRVVLGFSPTLYASSLRTFCFSYGVIIYITIIVLKEIKVLFGEREWKKTEGLLFGICCVFVMEIVARICGMY